LNYTLKIATLTLILLVTFSFKSQGQSNLREKTIFIGSDTIIVDSLSVVPGTFVSSPTLDSLGLRLDLVNALLIRQDSTFSDSLKVSYRVFPIKFSEPYFHKDSTLMVPEESDNFDPFVYNPNEQVENVYEFGGLNKSGSISRGIAFGNSQDLSVNSNLSLQLSGRLTDDIQIQASVTDDNIPIQPEGNTQQLEDFDQVYIELFNERSKLTAGDFQLTNPESFFMTYFKRARGATFQTNWDDQQRKENPETGGEFSAQASAAISKGKFARNIIQGVEGNQGPYRLTGANNEPFIIVLSGTERVYIDGKLQQRGQEYDYTIDYNTSEVTFTPNNLITKDRRIIVEFQYSEKNYARSMVQGAVNYDSEKYSWFVNLYGEQDSKNQPLQQDLDENDRQLLSDVGDEIENAVRPAIDSVDYTNDRVLYALQDSLGYDSVFVYSTNENEAFYQLRFSRVGLGNGDYVESEFTANGKTYRWVAPDTVDNQIVRNGNFAPVNRLVAPNKSQMAVGGGRVKVSDRTTVFMETAVSNYDRNTFSSRGNNDNVGLAVKAAVENELPLQREKDDPWKLVSRVDHELVNKFFEPIERFRAVEFERNWNIRNYQIEESQNITTGTISFTQKEKGIATVGGESFQAGEDFTGYKGLLRTDLQLNKTQVDIDGSYLFTQGNNKTEFLRHESEISQELPWFRLGFADIHELNQFFEPGTDTLLARTYQWYDWQVFIANPDTTKNRYRLFYRQRTDWQPLSNELVKSAFAEEYGGRLELIRNPKHQLKINVSNRSLRIVNSELAQQEPENTLVSRLEHSLRLVEGLITMNTFYEIGSGLEQRRVFLYLEVPAGQGVYVWNDYNEDGVKDLNEFEVAQFDYEANYIRSFVPSDDYSKTFTNQFSQSLQLNPARVWSDEKGFKKFVARFANQSSYKVERKTGDEEPLERFNPFLQDVADSSLITLNSTFRNTLFFNRTNADFGADYTYQDNRSKSLLTNGFDSRFTRYNELRVRWNFSEVFILSVESNLGKKGSLSDFLSGRNYSIDYNTIKPEITWQPNNGTRLALSAESTQKTNEEDLGGEEAEVLDIGFEGRFNKVSKGSFQVTFNAIKIDYNGSGNNSLSFEMLNGLQPGQNFTWSASIQRNIAENLQLNLIYNGRKSEDDNAIHSGDVQVRAFF
jgi:hypothetical protein